MRESKRWQTFHFWLNQPFKALSCMTRFTSQAPSTSLFFFPLSFFCPLSVWSPWICSIPPFYSPVCACSNPSPSPPPPAALVLSHLHRLQPHICSSSLSTSLYVPLPWTTTTATFRFNIPARLVRVCNTSFIPWCSFTLTLRFHHPPFSSPLPPLQTSFHISSPSVLWKRPDPLDFQLSSPHNCCINFTTYNHPVEKISFDQVESPWWSRLVLIWYMYVYIWWCWSFQQGTIRYVSNLELIFKSSPFITILHPSITDIPPSPRLRTPLL